MMRRMILSVGLLFSAVGCMDSRTAILVEKDGSGSIEQTLYTKPASFPGMPAPPKTTPEQDLQMIKAQSAMMASKMGEVTLKSVEPLEPRGEWKGHKVVFTFADISKVKLSMSPQPGPGKTDDKAIRFAFTKGDSPKLTVNLPPMTPSAPEGKPDAKPAGMPGGEEMLDAMLTPALFEGARIEFLVKVNGKITKTDASFVSMKKDAVGLIRADLDGLGKDQAAFNTFKATLKVKDPKANLEKLQDPALKKYLKFETKPQIEIEFN